MTLNRFASEPMAILNQLGIERAALLGHSWGGSVMTQFCLNHPERVSALVLSSPLLSTRRWVEDCNALVDQIHAELSDIDDINTEFNNRHFSRTNQPTHTLLAEKRRTNACLYEQMWGRNEFEHSGLLGDLDFFPNLSQLSAPTLLICGETRHSNTTNSAGCESSDWQQCTTEGLAMQAIRPTSTAIVNTLKPLASS